MKKLVLAALFVLIPVLAEAQFMPQGYQAKYCDMDMDHDGQMGGAADCDICDSTAVAPGVVGPENYAEWYVDCDAGVDDVTCGGVGGGEHMCKTLQYANNTRAAAAPATTPRAICFKGTCRAEPQTGTAPVAKATGGSYYDVTVPLGDGTNYTWKLYNRRTIIMGMDADNDQKYPSADAGDTAVIDGCLNKLYYAFSAVNGGGFELAHFSVRNHGSRDCIGQVGTTVGGFTPDTGFFNTYTGPGDVYIHDLDIDKVNYKQPLCDGTRGVSFSANTTIGGVVTPNPAWSYFWMDNLNVTNEGAYWWRGGVGTTTEKGPMRLSNSTLRFMGFSDDGSVALDCNQGVNNQKANYAVTVFKLWAHGNNAQIVNNIADAQTNVWQPKANNVGSAVNIDNCLWGTYVNNNSFFNFKPLITMQPSITNGGCNDRVTKDVKIIGNLLRVEPTSTYVTGGGNPMCINDEGGGNATFNNDHVENVLIANNICDIDSAGRAGIYSADGSIAGCGRTDTWTITNNTIAGIWGIAAININNQNYPTGPCVPKYIIRNNLTTRTGGSASINISSNNVTNSTSIQIDKNAWDTGSTMVWAGVSQPLANWNALSGPNYTVGTDKQCTALTMGTHDFRLQQTDTCAINAGGTESGYTRDYYGKVRVVPWDIGAAEYVAGSPATTTTTIPSSVTTTSTTTTTIAPPPPSGQSLVCKGCTCTGCVLK